MWVETGTTMAKGTVKSDSVVLSRSCPRTLGCTSLNPF